MPVRHRSNNRILPANSRAVDVAKRAIRDLTPVQQRRYHNAFAVQGYEAVVYNRLLQGTKCSCQAHRKVFAGLLDEDGKMPEGHMNTLLTGGLEFTIDRYGSMPKGRDDLREPRGIPALSRDDQFYGELIEESQTPFEIGGNSGSLDDPYVDVTNSQSGANGPNQNVDLDELVDGFDADAVDLVGTRCTVCFGHGFVGGFSVLGGWRKVIAPHLPEVYSVEGTIEVNRSPHAFFSTRVELRTIFPRGALFIDAFKFWNNVDQVVPNRVLLDGLPYSDVLLRALCDGREHAIVVEFEELSYWTHLEIQVSQSTKPSLIEFPRLQQSSNLSLLDLTEGVQLSASPEIPRLSTFDVIVESTFGKTFIINSSNWWNDKDRNVHGWDCQARVVQKNELLSLLPRRRQLGQRATHMVRDNADGIRRT